MIEAPAEAARLGAASHLVVTAGGVEGVGAAGEQRLVVARHEHFDVVVTFVLSGGEKSLMLPPGSRNVWTNQRQNQNKTRSGLKVYFINM